MGDFQVGDRVRYVGHREAGTIATVAHVGRYGTNIVPHFDGEMPTGTLWGMQLFAPHVDTFPIPADKDPWAKTEPAGDRFGVDCGLRGPNKFVCTRAKAHNGHHVARDDRPAGNVCERWPQEAAPEPEPAASSGWASTRVDTLRRPSLPKLSSMPLTGDLGGPAPRYELTDLFTAKLAIALFEEDNAVTIARVADDGHGGIGTAAARERCVWMSAEPQREAYMCAAAELLKRVGEQS